MRGVFSWMSTNLNIDTSVLCGISDICSFSEVPCNPHHSHPLILLILLIPLIPRIILIILILLVLLIVSSSHLLSRYALILLNSH